MSEMETTGSAELIMNGATRVLHPRIAAMVELLLQEERQIITHPVLTVKLRASGRKVACGIDISLSSKTVGV
jgi:hypothetical protein